MISSDSIALLFKARSDTSQARQDFNSLKNSVKKDVDSIESSFNNAEKVDSFFSSFLKANLVQKALSSISSAAFDAGRAVLDYSSKLEQTKIAYTTLLGNTAAANKLLKELESFARSTPFEFAGLTKLGQRLLGANIEAEKIIPTLTDIGNVAAATGDISQERIEGIVTALTQVITKQKLSAEEAEQFAERGINAYQLIAKATGKTQAEIRKLGEQGGLSADLLLRSLQKVSREKYGDAMKKQSETGLGAINNITDSLLQAGTKAFDPFYKEASQLAVRMAKEIELQNGDLNKIGNVIAKYIGEGLAVGLEAVAKLAGSYFGKRLKEIFSGSALVDPIVQSFIEGLTEGIAKAFGADSAFVKRVTAALRYGFSLGTRSLDDIRRELDQQDSALNAPRPYDYSRPQDRQPANQGNLQITQTPEQLAKEQKNQEEILKRNSSAQVSILKGRLDDTVKAFKQSWSEIIETFKIDKDTKKAETALTGLVQAVQPVVNQLLRQLEDEEETAAGLAKSTIVEINELREAQARRRKEIQDDFNSTYKDSQKEATEIEKNESEKRVKIAETEAERKIILLQSASETQIALLRQQLDRGEIKPTVFADAVGAARLKTLEDEKKAIQQITVTENNRAELSQRLALLDDEIARQRIENEQFWQEMLEKGADAEQKIIDLLLQRIEKEEELKNIRKPGDFTDEGLEVNAPNDAPNKSAFENLFGGVAQGIGDYLAQIGVLEEANGKLQFSFSQMFQSISDIGLNAFASLAQGFGQLVQNWVLYGNAGGQSLQKLAAQILSQVAATATTYAIMCLAAAALATTVFGAALLGGTPAQFLAAAALFGSIAVGTALAGRAIAGNSFNKGNQAFSGQTSGGYGSSASRADSGDVYSSNRDKQIVEVGRNLSQSVQNNISVSIRDKSGLFDQFFRLEVKRNGGLRDTIRQAAND